MKTRFKMVAAVAFILTAGIFSACDDDEIMPPKEGIERSELRFTEVSGPDLHAHGDHFHGLGNATEGDSHLIVFDESGRAVSGGHLHLEAEAVYKVELKAWDYSGKEVHQDFISSKAVADQYKVFLVGGPFVLNPDTPDESGALFQPREQQYGDGSAVNGSFETTGLLSYFTMGHANEGPTVDVSFILRKLSGGAEAKASITRTDWNHPDYQTRFAGEDVLVLKFEIHAEAHGHDH